VKFIYASVFLLFVYSATSFSQLVERTGDIFEDVSEHIANLPAEDGNEYLAPDDAQLDLWENTVVELLNGNFEASANSANQLGYQLVLFTDTFDIPNRDYYILENIASNYWGSYVYNPNFCRPLVIQAPHSKRDANTGLQGIHIFRETEALFYQVNGTHRCNAVESSSCPGVTTSCSATSEAYRISDLAHSTQSIFQKHTEVLLAEFDNTHFIQLHGFTKQDTDPYVILSNGTQTTPSTDFLSQFRDNLAAEDEVLTFRVAHIDIDWTRLRGFFNTQGRVINNSVDPCDANAETSDGRFFHVEQERQRLRSDLAAWDKVSNALANTFPCNLISSSKDLQN